MCIIHGIEGMNHSLFTGVALIHDFVVVEDVIKPLFHSYRSTNKI